MDSQTLHKALLRPETYNTDKTEITFKETHISRIYFVGDRVYKIKKPVDFGFLDFTTLEKRFFYCQEEVRLNQRFSEGIYLGVVEIRDHDGCLSIEGPGHTIEYAVMMKRLPEESMLPHLLAKNDPSLCDRMAVLARHIAERYQQLESYGPGADAPHLEVVKNNWQENFSQTEPFIGKTIDRNSFDQLQHYVLDFEKHQAELFNKREAQGWVRDGHGDLHCEHICFLDGTIAIYDCIEFNRRFRIADVLADLAFLLMDLELRGRQDLATVVRDNYLEVIGKTEDTELLLPFYQVYRAYVRGKVESFLSNDQNADVTNRLAAEARAKRYFNQALGYLCRAPRLILISGLMGVGKTTIARHLETSLGAKLLRSDEIRKELADIAPEQRCNEAFGEGIYSPSASQATYDLLLKRAMQTLQSGQTVIVDASFANRDERARFRLAAEQIGQKAWTIAVTCDREVALQRLDNRQSQGLDASDGRRALYDRQALAFDPIGKDPDVVQVDSTVETSKIVAQILCTMLNQA
ncbi:MAG: AAA family ATPase [Pedobacter sp.]